jgi:hypothetical protein
VNSEIMARMARNLLEDDAFANSLTRLEATYIEKWRRADTVEEREFVWHRLNALHEVRNDLQTVVDGQAVDAHNNRRLRQNQN